MSLFLASFSGVPGVGKSTAIRKLQEHRTIEQLLEQHGYGSGVRVLYVLEASDEWKRQGWLAAFYANRDLRALSFQILVYYSHKESVKTAVEEARAKWPSDRIICIAERSIYDQRLFWELQRDDGCASASPMDNMAYEAVWRDWRTCMPELNHIYFFKTSDLQQTMQRLKRRELEENIEVADGVPLDYQRKLLAKHEEWFGAGVARPLECPAEGIPCTHIVTDAPYHTDAAARTALGQAIFADILRWLTQDNN